MAVKPVEIDPKKATPEQIAKGLELLGKAETRKKRIQAGEIKGSYGSYADMTPEQKERAKLQNAKLRIKKTLWIQKAMDAGVPEPSEKDIAAEMKRRGIE